MNEEALAHWGGGAVASKEKIFVFKLVSIVIKLTITEVLRRNLMYTSFKIIVYLMRMALTVR